MTRDISVVVPTARGGEYVARCLAALAAQTLAPTRYETIVVDDSPSPATEDLVEAEARRAAQTGHRVRYLATPGRQGPAAARNAGWRAAEGAIIAFTDDDCLPAPTWLEEGLSAFTEGVGGVSGRVVVPVSAHPTDYERDTSRLGQAGEFVTANCFYRRDVLAMAGGFDERFHLPWREDSDLHYTLLRAGVRLVDAPRVTVTHPIRPASWGVSISQQRKSVYNALLYKKHPALYRSRVQASPPWRYYGIVGSIAIALLAIEQRRWRAGLCALTTWGMLTGLFVARRLQGTARTPRHISEMIVTSIAIPPLAIFWRLVGAIRFRVVFF